MPEPVVDAASLLAKLSSISGGNLANLASASTSTTVSTPQASQLSPPQQQDKDNALPPALARLLGGIVSTPQSPSSQASAPVAPPPTVPIPVPTNTGVINNAGLSAPPPQQQQPSMAATSDPRLRQFPQQSPPPRFQPNTNNVQQPPPRTRPSRWNNADDTRPIRREQPPLSSMPPSRDMMSPNSHSRPPPPSHPEQQLPGPIHDPSLQPGTIRGTLYYYPCHIYICNTNDPYICSAYTDIIRGSFA